MGAIGFGVVDAPGIYLLTGRHYDGSIAVPPGRVAIVRSSLAGAYDNIGLTSPTNRARVSSSYGAGMSR
jgi:hypothetical protein